MNSKPAVVESLQYCEAPTPQFEVGNPGLQYRESANLEEASPSQDRTTEKVEQEREPDALEELRVELANCQRDLEETVSVMWVSIVY